MKGKPRWMYKNEKNKEEAKKYHNVTTVKWKENPYKEMHEANKRLVSLKKEKVQLCPGDACSCISFS